MTVLQQTAPSDLTCATTMGMSLNGTHIVGNNPLASKYMKRMLMSDINALSSVNPYLLK